MSYTLLDSRVLLSIPADFNSAVVWMGSVLPLTFSDPSHFSRPLRTVLRVPTTILLVLFFFSVSTKFDSFFYWSPSDSKSLLSRTPMSILTDLNRAVVGMISILLLIFSCPILFSGPPTTICILVAYIIHR